MRKRDKKIWYTPLIVIAIIIAGLMLYSVIQSHVYETKGQKAMGIAMAYLKEKYEQEMIPIGARKATVDSPHQLGMRDFHHQIILKLSFM